MVRCKCGTYLFDEDVKEVVHDEEKYEREKIPEGGTHNYLIRYQCIIAYKYRCPKCFETTELKKE